LALGPKPTSVNPISSHTAFAFAQRSFQSASSGETMFEKNYRLQDIQLSKNSDRVSAIGFLTRSWPLHSRRLARQP
jgi:hypothetical protein